MGPVRGAKALYKPKKETEMMPSPPHNKTYFIIFHSPYPAFSYKMISYAVFI